MAVHIRMIIPELIFHGILKPHRINYFINLSVTPKTSKISMFTRWKSDQEGHGQILVKLNILLISGQMVGNYGLVDCLRAICMCMIKNLVHFTSIMVFK